MSRELDCIRRFCLDCQGGSPQAVRNCGDGGCMLWPWRLASLPTERAALMQAACADATRLNREARRAVRRHCLACAGGRADVRHCRASSCALWSFRFGVWPETYKSVRRRLFAPRELSLL